MIPPPARFSAWLHWPIRIAPQPRQPRMTAPLAPIQSSSWISRAWMLAGMSNASVSIIPLITPVSEMWLHTLYFEYQNSVGKWLLILLPQLLEMSWLIIQMAPDFAHLLCGIYIIWFYCVKPAFFVICFNKYDFVCLWTYSHPVLGGLGWQWANAEESVSGGPLQRDDGHQRLPVQPGHRHQRTGQQGV